jgi:hypothetical protein
VADLAVVEARLLDVELDALVRVQLADPLRSVVPLGLSRDVVRQPVVDARVRERPLLRGLAPRVHVPLAVVVPAIAGLPALADLEAHEVDADAIGPVDDRADAFAGPLEGDTLMVGDVDAMNRGHVPPN